MKSPSFETSVSGDGVLFLYLWYTISMGILLRWLISGVVIFGVAYFIPGVEVKSFYTSMIVALFLGLINATIRPILVFLTLPFTVVTLGLWLFVINGFLLWFLASILDGFAIDGFLTAVLASALISIATWFLTSLFKKES